MKKVLNYIWQLPQNILGIIYKYLSSSISVPCVENIYTKEVNSCVYLQKYKGGLSLGKYIFIYQDYKNWTNIIKHECGHCKQSKILGPLYIPIIGIPSLLWAIIHRYIIPNKNYYSFYTEKWANNLMRNKK